MEPYLKRGLREKGLDIIPLNIGNKLTRFSAWPQRVKRFRTLFLGSAMGSLHGGEREKEREGLTDANGT
jgi:hypothetical protein